MMDDAAVKALDKEVLQEVSDAYQFADEAPDPEPEALFTDVYVDGGTA
jgi:TPP-dependent pyruvate/acetoin dehydrogenase alpha subunit